MTIFSREFAILLIESIPAWFVSLSGLVSVCMLTAVLWHYRHSAVSDRIDHDKFFVAWVVFFILSYVPEVVAYYSLHTLSLGLDPVPLGTRAFLRFASIAPFVMSSAIVGYYVMAVRVPHGSEYGDGSK